MQVSVRRSSRRKKTVQARVINGVLEVAIPAHMSKAEERHWIGVMEERFARKEMTESLSLPDRAGELAHRYGLPLPSEIVWSERQRTLWGSCTPTTGRVRIATRVSAFPNWVVDYVIVHELAHLVEANHGKAFWNLVNEYPAAEKARGYLEAKADER